MTYGSDDSISKTNASRSGPRTVLAFDYGKKRIGVATGQELTCTASALTTIHAINNQPDWNAITELITKWQPDALIIGVPYHMDGDANEMTVAAQHFGRQLAGRYNLLVYEMDERLTSHEAYDSIVKQRSVGQRKKTKKQDIDMLAAQIILQSWLDQQENCRDNQ